MTAPHGIKEGTLFCKTALFLTVSLLLSSIFLDVLAIKSTVVDVQEPDCH